ncbi:hypothetical protein, partial [Phenylobacterium sp.]|uniref:hypothetical protein n=1 Tax=Phenylobacterium sp. TaxID=1871053 RepID=UPI002F42EAB8
MMKHLRSLGARALACLALAFASPALADNQTAKNASSTTFSFCTKTVAGVEHYCHVAEGYTGSAYVPFLVDSAGRLNINVNGSVTVVGGAASGSPPSGNPNLIAGSDGTAVHTIGAYIPGDAFSTAPYGIATTGRNMVYNGTSWDMQRAAAHGYNATGIGLTAAALTAEFDDVSPTTVTENQFGTVRMNADRALYVASDPAAPIVIASTVANPASTLTRPADTTPYAANDLVASSTTAGSVTVPSFTATRVAAGSFRVAELRLASNHTTGLSGVQVTVR